MTSLQRSPSQADSQRTLRSRYSEVRSDAWSILIPLVRLLLSHSSILSANPDPLPFSKWTLHTLRLYNFGPLGAGEEEHWHAVLAGFVSGFSVLAEKKSRRITLGQQLLVRGLQGRYNVLKSRGKIPIKNVSVWVFGLSCANIMFSWLVSLNPPFLLQSTT